MFNLVFGFLLPTTLVEILLVYGFLFPIGYLLGRFLSKEAGFAVAITFSAVYLLANLVILYFGISLGASLGGGITDSTRILYPVLETLGKSFVFMIDIVGSYYLGAYFKKSTKS